MVAMEEHDCRSSAIARWATAENPYHFTESGLSNVYLIGIRCFKCNECEEESAEIPAIEELLRLMAKDVVLQETALTGEEIRFLRKRMGVKAKDFAKMNGITPEYLSRRETGAFEPKESSNGYGSLDRLIRLVYALHSHDEELISEISMRVADFLTGIEKNPTSSPIVMQHLEHDRWSTQKKTAA